MSGLYKKSMWWLFFLIFGLTIGAIQSLGRWTREASAQAQEYQPSSLCAGKQLQTCEPKHWRSMVMQP
jgi:hypothetical protein